MAAKKKDTEDSIAAEGGDTEAPVSSSVEMRVTTKGHGKIHTGEFEKGTHVPKFYNKGDVIHAPDREAADLLMDRGLADET